MVEYFIPMDEIRTMKPVEIDLKMRKGMREE
jgi:hypothetical protein